MSEKTAETVSGYVRWEIAEAARGAAQRSGMKLAQWTARAIEEKLEREGALPDQVDEREVVIRGLEEEFTLEELRELLRGRQGDKARGAA